MAGPRIYLWSGHFVLGTEACKTTDFSNFRNSLQAARRRLGCRSPQGRG